MEDSLLRPPPVLLYSFRSRSDALAHPYCRTVRQRRRIFSRKQRKRRKSAAWKFGQPHPLKEVEKTLVSLSPSFARLSKNIRSNSPPLQLSRVLDPHPSSPHLLLPREMEVGFISRTAEEERERRPTPPPPPPVLIPPSVWCLFCGACFFPPPPYLARAVPLSTCVSAVVFGAEGDDYKWIPLLVLSPRFPYPPHTLHLRSQACLKWDMIEVANEV